MKRILARHLRRGAALAILAAAATLCGCFNPFSPLRAGVGFSQPAPTPNSATNLLRLFEWCYNNKAIAEYREIFSDDLRFVFSPLDSAGADYRGTPWTREDELISTTNLFVGGSADQPPASSIQLTLDKNFVVYADPDHFQWDPLGRWHTNVRTQVVLNIQTGDGNAINISGAAVFYLVRGDSAVIPEELQARGFGPDSNRWYIRRWVDETAQAGPGPLAAKPVLLRMSDGRRVSPVGGVGGAGASARMQPSAAVDLPMIASWGYVKDYYRRVYGAGTLRAAPVAQRR